MPSIFPEAESGGVVIRNFAGDCLAPGNVPNAYCPPIGFTSSCQITALPSDCAARLTVGWANAINSELLCLAVTFDPDGNWNCGELCNLGTAFTNWFANFETNELVPLINSMLAAATVGFIMDAPADDYQYARKNGAWNRTSTPIVTTVPPVAPLLDGQLWWNPSNNQLSIWQQATVSFSLLNPINPAPPDAISSMNEIFVTATTTYNKPVGLKYLEVEGVGPGGGAGGAAATVAANTSCASGGAGAGAWGKRLFTAASLAAATPITIGAIGIGATATTGTGGGTSEFGTGLNCTLGGGGTSARTTVVVVMARSNGGLGGVKGTGWTSGRDGEEGDAGYAAFANEVNLAQRGAGGATLYGISSASAVTTGAGGAPGTGYGSGGSGTCNAGPAQAARTGGNGAPSFFRLREYF